LDLLGKKKEEREPLNKTSIAKNGQNRKTKGPIKRGALKEFVRRAGLRPHNNRNNKWDPEGGKKKHGS